MLILIYDAVKGHPYRDGEVLSYVQKLCEAAADVIPFVITFSTTNILSAIRLAVHQGKLSCSDVELYFCDANGVDQKLHINNNGHLKYWPDGFCDTERKIRMSLLFGSRQIP